MNKYDLQSRIKSTGMAYVMWFFLGAHYAYLGRWGIQLLYWFTLGGIGVWAFIDLFTMSGKVNAYNAPLFLEIQKLEQQEKDENHRMNLAMMAAATGKSKGEE